jgi:hypothetical protein
VRERAPRGFQVAVARLLVGWEDRSRGIVGARAGVMEFQRDLGRSEKLNVLVSVCFGQNSVARGVSNQHEFSTRRERAGGSL